MACCDGQKWPRTFWLREVAFLDSSLESAVEHRVELSLACVLDLVVGLDILLDSLSAVGGDISQLVFQIKYGALWLLRATCAIVEE